jgi:hypothetical protein
VHFAGNPAIHLTAGNPAVLNNYFTCHSCCHLLAVLPQKGTKRGSTARVQSMFKNGNYYPEINKADLDQVYSLAKSEDSDVKENDVKERGIMKQTGAVGTGCLILNHWVRRRRI